MLWLLSIAFATDIDAPSLQALDPVLFDELMTLEPVPNRAGVPRFAGPALDADQAPEVLAHRLQTAEETPEVRAALAATIAHIADPELVTQLIADEGDADVRLHLYQGLEKAPAEVAFPVLQAALTDDAPGVRAEAARVLGNRADCGDAADALVAALDDPTAEVRMFAARSLGYHAVPVYDAILPLLQDEDAKVRLTAVRSLGRIDATRAATDVAPLASDVDPKVARKAATLSGAL
jgi:HEAT repeat protein